MRQFVMHLFDEYDKKTTVLKNTYETINQYHVSWKAISTGADVVKVSINFGTAKDLVFKQEEAKLIYNEFTNIQSTHFLQRLMFFFSNIS